MEEEWDHDLRSAHCSSSSKGFAREGQPRWVIHGWKRAFQTQTAAAGSRVRPAAWRLQLVWGAGRFCSICTVIPVRRRGKEPVSSPETWGFWEKLGVVLLCAWGGKGAPRVWHREEEEVREEVQAQPAGQALTLCTGWCRCSAAGDEPR